MDSNIIEMRKKYSKLINESKRQAKQEKCLWCGKKITRFCNSHSVPRCVLDNIDTDGKVDYFNAIVNIPFINSDKGMNEAGTFKLLCPECDAFVSGEKKTNSELAIEKWIYSELENPSNAKDRKEFFNASKYKSYIVSNNEKVKYVFDNFLADKWKKEDRKLNNYVHTNGKNFLMNNYIYQNRKEQQDNELIETVQNITDIFLSLLALIDSKKLQSSDYLDALEMNIEPLEESQYWICPIIEEYMNDRFSKKMLQYIQKNERNGMQIIKQGFSYDGGTTHGA